MAWCGGVELKCAACGYEYSEKGQWADKVIYYQSGKKKGEIKEIKQEWINTSVGYDKFIELKFKKEVDTLVYDDGDGYYSEREVSLYACPECHTVRFE